MASLEIEGGPGLSPINIGIIVSCSLIGLVILIQVGSQNIHWSQLLQCQHLQVCQNVDRKLSFLTPCSYRSFTPDK